MVEPGPFWSPLPGDDGRLLVSDAAGAGHPAFVEVGVPGHRHFGKRVGFSENVPGRSKENGHRVRGSCAGNHPSHPGRIPHPKEGG